MTVKQLIEELQNLRQDRQITFYSCIENYMGESCIEVKEFELEDDGRNDHYRLCISGIDDGDEDYD